MAVNANIALLQQYADLLGYDVSKLNYTTTGDSRMAMGAGRNGQYLYGTPSFNTGLRSGTYGQQATDVTGTVQGVLDGLTAYEKSKLVKDSQGRLAYGTLGNISAPVNDQTINLPGVTKSSYFDPNARTTKTNSGFMVTKDYFGDLSKQFQQDNPGYMQAPLNDKGEPDFPRIWGEMQHVKYDPTYGYIIPKEAYHETSPDAVSRYGPYVPLLLFGAGVAATMSAGGGAAAGATGAGTSTGTAAASGVGASGSTTLGAASTGTGTGLASGAGTFNGIGLGSGLGSGGLVGGTASTGAATGTGTFFGISGAGSTGAALGTTAAGGIGVSSLGSGSGISTSGAAAQSFGIPASGYPGAGVTAAGGLAEGGTLQGTYGTGAGALGNTSGTANAIGGSGLTTQQIMNGLGKANDVVGALGAVGGAGAGGGGGGGSSGGGNAPVTPHNVTWTPWTSPTTALKAQPQSAPPQAAPLQFQPAQNYQQLRQQQSEYDTYIADQLQRSRNQRLGL